MIEVTFLGYIVTGNSIKIDPAKVKAIISWSTPSTIHDIRSFYGLASFYRRFIWNFSSITAPFTECMKGGRFTWTSEATKVFDILKAKVTMALVLALPTFDEVFQFECAAFEVGIGGFLSQNQRLIAFFSEKLNDAICKYSTYDNRRHSLITTMKIRVQCFDSFRGLYCNDPDFRDLWSKCDNGHFQQFSKLDGYLFKGAWLCIPLCSLREAIILEGHVGGLAGHFKRDKTLALLHEQFYWPKMEHDVNRLLERCRTCHIAKTHSSNAGLYTPLSVLVAPWEYVSLDFVLGLPRTQRAKDSVMLHGVPKTLTFDRAVKFVSHLWHTLWTRMGDNAKQWDIILPQAELAHSRSVNRTTGKSLFEVVYGRNPITPMDLVLVLEVGQFSEEGADKSEQIKELHRTSTRSFTTP
uniref:Reverse transcriptase domain-containing protein n=1 Tax=Tanacetum cinerariifolium TaxID=118510 RepID=A0A6L2K1U0_TANCI|nr:hypothetical protein [Tanacetum cinerariifolium]